MTILVLKGNKSDINFNNIFLTYVIDEINPIFVSVIRLHYFSSLIVALTYTHLKFIEANC